jgi:3-oxoacyl-[acyl-carrier protein] reductase
VTQADVAIVTGASRGIGKQVARLLAKKGIAVVVNYANLQEQAEGVAAAIRAESGRAVAIRADVSNIEEVREMYDRAERELGPVTILINNAGVSTPKLTNLVDIDDDTYEHIFSVNTRGAFYMLREAGRRMPRGGRIVNLSSSVVRLKVPGHSVYAGSKAAIEAFTAIYARELLGREITVNCIAPGPTTTDFLFQGKSPEQIEQYQQRTPLGRLAKPEDIANAVVFLVSPEGSWVNGQIIDVTGGML